MDLPLEVNPITVLVNNTNPRALLTRICDTLSTNRVHGVVFEDNIGSEAVAQILDFISTQTAVPIVGISGGSAVVLPYKVSVTMGSGRRRATHYLGGTHRKQMKYTAFLVHSFTF